MTIASLDRSITGFDTRLIVIKSSRHREVLK